MDTGCSPDDLAQRLAWVGMGLVWPGRSLAGLNMSCQGTEQVAGQVAGEARGARCNDCTRRGRKGREGKNRPVGLDSSAKERKYH